MPACRKRVNAEWGLSVSCLLPIMPPGEDWHGKGSISSESSGGKDHGSFTRGKVVNRGRSHLHG
jgi:hypothetical protein